MATTQRVDWLTIAGLGLMLMPLTTMWHEIGGHAATCLVLGGRVSELGAFYVKCDGLGHGANVVVALAGASVDTVAALGVFQLWHRAKGDLARLVLWLVWIDKAMVAAGYLCFSGATGLGDLGPGATGGIGPLPMPLLWRAGELAIGIAAYIWIVRKGIATLSAMVGDGAATAPARKRVAHGYYLAAGVTAVLVGLLNPLGVFITIASAMASSFGGLAGLISIGFAVPHGEAQRTFIIPRNWPLAIAGLAVALAFAAILGPSLHP